MEAINVRDAIAKEESTSQEPCFGEPMPTYYGKPVPVDADRARARRNGLEDMIARLDEMIRWNSEGMPEGFKGKYRQIRALLVEQEENEHRIVEADLR